MEIRFTQAARKHRVGRTSARHVVANTSPMAKTTAHGSPGWRYVGPDERDRELEIVAVELAGATDETATLLVIHVMPTGLRGSDPDG